MNIEQAKAIPLSVLLDKLNIKTIRHNQNEFWCLSPLRNERTPSFHVNKKKNTWYDFGIDKGGDVISFVCAYLESQEEGHTVSDALRWIKNMSGYSPTIKSVQTPDYSLLDSKLVIRTVNPLSHISLKHYLDSRGISRDLASEHLKEIKVLNRNTEKSFFALGLRNEAKGFELRNPFFKGCVGAKSISFIRGKQTKSDGINIFEGFMDYLSLITQLKELTLNDDSIILNSLSCLKKATPYIKNYGYKTAYTWMDNDDAGKKATLALHEFLKTEKDLQHRPMNELYAGHKDVNAWHMKNLGL